MINSELVETLRVFSSAEQKRLAFFLQSPYCTDGEDVGHELKLLLHLFNSLNQNPVDKEALSKAAVYQIIFPGRSFSVNTLNNLSVSTLKLVRRFVESEMARRSARPVGAHAALVNFFREKGAFELSEKYLHKLEREIKQQGPWDDLDYYWNWDAEEAKTMFFGTQSQVTGDFNLLNTLEALDRFYLIKRLNTLTTLFNQNRLTPILSPEQRQAYLDELEQWSAKPFFRDPVVVLSYQVLVFFHLDGEPAEQAFREFMALLSQYETQLSVFHLNRLESFAYNFCVRRFQAPEYRNLLFDLFKKRLQPERFSLNGTIQANELLSMTTLGLIGKQYEWVMAFLETYRSGIQGSQSSEDYFLFNLACYYFQLGRFDEARDILVRLNFHELQYKYIFKTLEIKLFFETGEEDYELVENKLNTLKVAIHRENKMPREKQQRYNQFVNFMMRINRLRGQPDLNRARLLRIYEDVRNNRNTVEWNWLMEKLKQMIGPEQ